MKKKNSPEKASSKYEMYRETKTEEIKPKNFFKTFFRLFSLLKGNSIKVFFVVVLGVVSAALSVIGPRYLGDVINLISVQVENKLTKGFIDFREIAEILLTILTIYSLSAFFSFLLHFIMAGVTQNLITDLREKLNRKFSVLPLAFFDSHNKGDLLSRLTNDIDNINNSFENIFIQIVNSIVTFFGVLIVMFRYNVIMSVASTAPIPVGAIIALIILTHSKKFFRLHWEITGDINGHIEEMFTGHKIVKAFGHEEKAIEEFRQINKELYEAGRKAQFYSGFLGPLINFANNLGYVFICVIGGYLIISGKSDVGAITVFMAYSKMFMQPLVDMSNIVNQLQSSLASAERVFEIIDEKEEVADTAKVVIEKTNGHVSIKDVNFSYVPEKPLIENFSLEVKPGELVAIVGPTGAGKTTIVNLLMRFYEIQSGKIEIDGIDIRDISRENLHNIFSMVLQDTWLFAGTIRENIMYGHENKSAEELERAVKAARVDCFCENLPEGLDTMLEEDGANLSAGQRQLITIARAILADPDILILDEATSSVDTRTELQLQEAMGDLMKGRTNFVIAHRLSTIKQANNIIFIDGGVITEHGTHDELMKKNGDYAKLYNSQFVSTTV